MRIDTIGVTAVKGMAHRHPDRVELWPDGVVGDRLFCLLDELTGQVVRTAENAGVLACRATWCAPELTIDTPIGSATGTVCAGRAVVGNYWGRPAPLSTVEGPWTALLRRYLGRDVTLCRVTRPGSVIWSGAVSIVTRSSVADLAARLDPPLAGQPDGPHRQVDANEVTTHTASRFRATFVVAGDEPAFAENDWAGRRLRIGGTAGGNDGVLVTVRGPMPRCAVVDRDPRSGHRDARVLATLAADRTVDGDIAFGVQGDVVRGGVVARGDAVVLVDEDAE